MSESKYNEELKEALNEKDKININKKKIILKCNENNKERLLCSKSPNKIDIDALKLKLEKLNEKKRNINTKLINFNHLKNTFNIYNDQYEQILQKKKKNNARI